MTTNKTYAYFIQDYKPTAKSIARNAFKVKPPVGKAWAEGLQQQMVKYIRSLTQYEASAVINGTVITVYFRAPTIAEYDKVRAEIEALIFAEFPRRKTKQEIKLEEYVRIKQEIRAERMAREAAREAEFDQKYMTAMQAVKKLFPSFTKYSCRGIVGRALAVNDALGRVKPSFDMQAQLEVHDYADRHKIHLGTRCTYDEALTVIVNAVREELGLLDTLGQFTP